MSANTLRQNEAIDTKDCVRRVVEEVHHHNAYALTVYVLCHLISIYCIGYFVVFISQTLTSVRKFQNNYGFPVVEVINNGRTWKLVYVHETEKEDMILHVKEIVIWNLRNVFYLLIFAGIMDITQVVLYILFGDHSSILFGILNCTMVVIVIQSLSVHCFYGILDKFACLRLKLSRILNWKIEWDELFKKEMEKPEKEMLGVCKAVKILQYVLYFAIITIIVLCTSEYCAIWN